LNHFRGHPTTIHTATITDPITATDEPPDPFFPVYSWRCASKLYSYGSATSRDNNIPITLQKLKQNSAP
jgi:hypothetical protein